MVEMFARFAEALHPAVAASRNVWLARPPLFPLHARMFWPNSPRDNDAHVWLTADYRSQTIGYSPRKARINWINRTDKTM